jgi:hypothetical protein
LFEALYLRKPNDKRSPTHYMIEALDLVLSLRIAPIDLWSSYGLAANTLADDPELQTRLGERINAANAPFAFTETPEGPELKLTRLLPGLS